VRLVGPNGEQVGIVRVEDALRLAEEADLDLVEVAPEAKPPVCKLMDFGKFKYESAMKDREARKNQSNTVLKTVRLRLKIDPHDYETKKVFAQKFLEGGDKVKVMIMFRGREQSRPEMGLRLLQRFANDVADLGSIESSPQQDGRNMVMVMSPSRRKADVKSEQKAEQRTKRDADRIARIERAERERAEQSEKEQAAPAPAPEVSPIIAEGDEPLFVRRAPSAAPAPAAGGGREGTSRPYGGPPSRGGDRFERPARPDRFERPGADRPERSDRPERFERPGADRPERSDRPERFERPDRPAATRGTSPGAPSRPLRPAPRPATAPGSATPAGPGARPAPAGRPAPGPSAPREGAAPAAPPAGGAPAPRPPARPAGATPGPRPVPRPAPRPARPTAPPPSDD